MTVLLVCSSAWGEDLPTPDGDRSADEDIQSSDDSEHRESLATAVFQPPGTLNAVAPSQPRPRFTPSPPLRFGTAGVARRTTNQPTYMVADTTAGGCGGLFIDGSLVASIMHPTFACSRLNIAENNSPIVNDRAYFSYRHFHNASEIEVFSNTPGGGQAHQNIDRYTFGVEKVLFDRHSVEFRLPINSQLNSDLFFAQYANEETTLPLRDYTAELGNVALILKSQILELDDLILSGGLAFNFPTAPHVRIRGLVDDPNFVIRDNNGDDTGLRADVDLTIDGLVENETVNVSPFLGYVAMHSENWFTQGFAQIDVAMNESDAQLQLEADVRFFGFPLPIPPFDESDRLAQQTLLRFNWGVGYWLLQNEAARYLNQFGVMFEVHYTTTLNDAKLLGPVEVLPEVGPIPAVELTVGNIDNRVDVLNMVLAIPTRIGQTTFTHGFAAPVRELDHGFDFEYSLLVNRQF